MEEPRRFAGRVIKKFGKLTVNDYEQPQKWFVSMAEMYKLLDDVPFSAVENLEQYEENRDIMINIVRRIFKIFDAAQIDFSAEIDRIDGDDPFDGLEEDLKLKKSKSSKTNDIEN